MLGGFYPQASSQWDSLRHVRCREFGFYGGATGDPDTHGRLGIESWVTGVVGRGVLVDVDGHLRVHGRPLEPTVNPSMPADLLAEVAAAPGRVERGPVTSSACGPARWPRTRAGRRRSAGSYAVRLSIPGAGRGRGDGPLPVGHEASRPSPPTTPPSRSCPAAARSGSLHRRLIPLLGFMLGELFDLDELPPPTARRTARSTCLFVAVPLNVPGGVGSPGNAIAVK